MGTRTFAQRLAIPPVLGRPGGRFRYASAQRAEVAFDHLKRPPRCARSSASLRPTCPAPTIKTCGFVSCCTRSG
jgi:hypothetical protein